MFKARETRDSLREEISQNLNENLTEHEVVTWTIVHLQDSLPNDTVKVERVTSRTRQSGAELRVEGEKVKVEAVRDTIYVEQRDTIRVQEFKGSSGSKSLNSQHSTLNWIKWLTALICAITVLIITIKVCLTFGFPPSRKA